MPTTGCRKIAPTLPCAPAAAVPPATVALPPAAGAVVPLVPAPLLSSLPQAARNARAPPPIKTPRRVARPRHRRAIRSSTPLAIVPPPLQYRRVRVVVAFP